MIIHEEILKWAKEYVPQFNKLSVTYHTHYYTQSPLDSIDKEVDLMIIGINPKGNLGNGSRELKAEEYIKGNSFWFDRFDQNGKIAWKTNQGARYFLGFDDFYHPESIDNDKKTVWTNLSPFESQNGSSDLNKELKEVGIKSTLDLIKILRPKRIILLGINAFRQISQVTGNDNNILEFSTVFNNIKAQVGRIYNIPTTCICHPTGHWEVNNTFYSMFVFLHGLAEITKDKDTIKPLDDVVNIMRREMRGWQEKISI